MKHRRNAILWAIGWWIVRGQVHPTCRDRAGGRRRERCGAARAAPRRARGGPCSWGSSRRRSSPRGSCSRAKTNCRGTARGFAARAGHADPRADPGNRPRVTQPRGAGAGMVRPALGGLVPYEPGKPVETVQRELGLERVVKLASNEGPFGTFPGRSRRSSGRSPSRPLPRQRGSRLREELAGQARSQLRRRSSSPRAPMS